MAKQTINIGASPNDGTGTPLRTAFDYTNQNFTELYTALGGGVGLPGAITQVLFNNGTNVAGDAGLVYNSTTDALTIGGNVQAASATITGALTVNGLSNFSGAFAGNYGLTINNTTNNAAGYLKISGTGTGGGGEIDFYNGATAWGGIKCTSSSQLEFLSNAFSTLMTLNSTGLLVGTTATSYGAAGRGLVVAGGSTSAIIGMRVGSTDTGYIFADATKVELGGNGAVPIVINNGGAAITIDTARNVGIGVSTFGTSATKVLGLANATAPSTSPAGMGQLYVEAGALKYRGSSGTVTTIAAA